MMTDVLEGMQAVRERVWRRLIQESAAPADSYGKIPGGRATGGDSGVASGTGGEGEPGLGPAPGPRSRA
jgi:hypothetical protein